MKFTFKTEKATGRYRSFFPDSHYIKLKKLVVGQIEDKKPHKIRLKVMKKDGITDNNPNCDWKWIQLKKEFDSVDDAKVWLNENIEGITNTWELHGD